MNEMKVPEGWELKKLCDIGEIITGSTPKTTNLEYYGDDFPFYGPTDLGTNAEISKSQKGLTQKGLSVAREIPEDSILVQCIGDLGKSSIIKKRGACNQQINVIVPNKQTVVPKFVYYWINCDFFRNSMKQNATQTTLPILNKTKFSNLFFLLPDYKTQEKIVVKLDHILGELEKKKKQILSLITLNKERIDYFEKNWLSYVIDREIEHHPERKNWNSKRLDSFAKVGQGGTPSRKMPQYWNGDIPWLSSGELRNNEITNSNEKITKLGLENSSTQYCPKGTVLIAMTGQGLTRGRTALLKINACANQSCAHMIVKEEEIIPEFLWLYLQSQYWNIRSIHHGSGQPGINTTMIKSWEIPLPTLPIQKQIIQNIKSAQQKLQAQKQQFQNIKNSYESTIKYIEHIQSSILDTAFSGKLVN